ncbi:MAG: phosphoenolpyruvate--protein phosphotransferase [Alphaproteobacteria bacterium]|nr:phosphoenolpyruvate--protein phosphotransferase [Alphaproteobacteria bacterium]MBF0128972.1 phosphoenolpyruvate--protein phosphotransferase [Alphaproteobacteria bacterium]
MATVKPKAPPEKGSSRKDAPRERVFQGQAVGPGIAIGTARVHDSTAVSVPEYRIPVSAVARERARFADATADASDQVARLQLKAKGMGGAAGEDLSYLLEAYQQMLRGSRLIRGVERRIIEDRINAEAAVHKEIARMIDAFSSMDDAYLASRIDDIRDVGGRLLRSLTKTPYRPFAMLPRNAIIITEELTPADTAVLDPRIVAGFVTMLGGVQSHTAIMARSLGFPAVMGVAGLVREVQSGAPMIVDGLSGKVIVDPLPETVDDYRRQRARFHRERRALTRLKTLPAITRNGVHIELNANIELPGESEVVLQSGAEGIGLLRSEFMFMNRDDLPGEDEQFELLRTLVESMEGRVVTIRTLDCGGDKVGVPLGICAGPNPALGLRAIRLGLNQPSLLEDQLSAILRAGVFGPVRILLPMVATVDELMAVREILGRVVRRLTRRRVALPDPLPPLGVMIEIPGAALSADALAAHCDFFSIGTNDLTQYTLAIDRTDEAVAHLYDSLHPAVLRLIQFATEAATRARIPVSVCGEMAGSPRYTALLLGLGIRELSMSSSNIPPVKRRIRSLHLPEAIQHARVVMDQSAPGVIARLVDEFNSAE